jgi:5-methylcytosine-specific restriction endonuclease McrA
MTKEEKRAYHAQYYKDHKDEINVRVTQYNKDNKEQKKAYNIQWYSDNRTTILLTNAQWRKDNKEWIMQYQKDNKEVAKQYRNDNVERLKEQRALWRKNNPDQVAKLSSNRQFKLEQATPYWSETKEIKVVYLKRDEYRNIYGIPFEVDHIIPINSDTVCGLHVLANLQLLDKSLNSSKHNYHQSDW